MKLQSNYTAVHFTGKKIGNCGCHFHPGEAFILLQRKALAADQGIGSKVTRPDLVESGAVAGFPVRR
jgi:hypothetical protein